MAANKVVVVRHAGVDYEIETITPGIIDTVGHIRFKQADNSLVDTGNPIPIPTGSPNYSWRKSLKLKFTSAPPVQITNLRWFTDPANPLIAPGVTGVVVRVGATNTYTTPTVSDNTTDVIVASPAPGMSGGGNVTTRTSGSPMVLVGTGSVTSTADPVLTAPSTGVGNQPFVIQQMEVSSTASSGPTASLVFSYRYDEN